MRIQRFFQPLRQKKGMTMAIFLVVMLAVLALTASLLASTSALMRQADIQQKQDRCAAQARSFGEVLQSLMETTQPEANSDAAELQSFVNQFVLSGYKDYDENDPFAETSYLSLPAAADDARLDGVGDMAVTLRRQNAKSAETTTTTGFENRTQVEYSTQYEIWLQVDCTLDGVTATDVSVYNQRAHYALEYYTGGEGENRTFYYYKEGEWYTADTCDAASKITFEEGMHPETQSAFEAGLTIARDLSQSPTVEYTFIRRE